MTASSVSSGNRVSVSARWRELGAGALAAIVTLPICLASGVLALAPLGPGYVSIGAAAGLCGAIVAGAVAALTATSSFIVTAPRISVALVVASLAGALLLNPVFAGDKGLIMVAIGLCVLLAGLWQALFGLFGVASVIKFTPHPVLAGFLNGVALLVIFAQIKPFVVIGAPGSIVAIVKPAMLVFVLAVAVFVLSFPALTRRLRGAAAVRRVPPVLAGFVFGIAVFYAMRSASPSTDLGPTIGSMQVSLTPPLAGLGDKAIWRSIAANGWHIVTASLVLAIVATLESLLAFRTAQNMAGLQIHPVRDLFAQGLGNCASALAGGLTSAPSPNSMVAAWRAGGRTRLTPLFAALIFLVSALALPGWLAAIPSAVLSAILLALGILLLDRWTFRLVTDMRRDSPMVVRRRASYDLAVVFAVISVTVATSVIHGVIVGSVLAGIIFIINMSRPVVKRCLFGGDISSKRIRPAEEAAYLRDSGAQRAVLQLEGVLFFGNADNLARKVGELFETAGMVTLDLRAISDIDISGVNVFANLLAKSRETKKSLLFCNVPPSQEIVVRKLVGNAEGAVDPITPDLDSALEWMEEESLKPMHGKQTGELPLAQVDFFNGVADDDLARLRTLLTRREFAPGQELCREGDAGDRMWMLTKGSVSVRLMLPNGGGSRRIASLARGTTIGEMALIEDARRSAMIVADDNVVCYELARDAFARMLKDEPAIATILLRNLARELARRLRRTSDDLRSLSN